MSGKKNVRLGEKSNLMAEKTIKLLSSLRHDESPEEHLIHVITNRQNSMNYLNRSDICSFSSFPVINNLFNNHQVYTKYTLKCTPFSSFRTWIKSHADQIRSKLCMTKFSKVSSQKRIIITRGLLLLPVKKFFLKKKIKIFSQNFNNLKNLISAVPVCHQFVV